MTELTAQIDHALTSPDPDTAVERIKESVAGELRRLDPLLESIAFLNDFNHTYRPDLMLTWRQAGKEHTRPVYLRLVASGRPAQLDVETLNDRHPLFIGLLHHRVEARPEEPADVPGEPADVSDEVIANVAAGSAFVTDASAIDALDSSDDARIPAVASSVLVRSGSGILRSPEAARMRVSVAAGYGEAIGAGDPAKVDQATESLRPFLSEVEVDRLDLYLDLLWVGAGGDLNELPDAERLLHADLSTDELLLLLEHFLTREEPSDSSLWSTLGARLKLDEASEVLSSISSPRHLDEFIEANAVRWSGRYAGLASHPDMERRGWWITDQALAYAEGPRSIIYTALKRKWNQSGLPLARRPFEAIRSALHGDKLLSIDAVEGGTSIRLSGQDELPADRVDRVVDWTDQVQAVVIQTTIGGDDVEVEIDYAGGRVRASSALPLRELRDRAERYLSVAPAQPTEADTVETDMGKPVDEESEKSI